MKKVAIFGKMRSGKDTVGDILINKYGYKRYSYGDAIKNIIADYFQLPEGVKPRKHLQLIGQTFRKLDPDIWVKYLNKKIADEGEELVVITDARQENEYLDLKKQGYLIIKVETDEDIRIERIKAKGEVPSDDVLNHETELFCDKVQADITIKNNGTLLGLSYLVDKVIKDFGGCD